MVVKAKAFPHCWKAMDEVAHEQQVVNEKI